MAEETKADESRPFVRFLRWLLTDVVVPLLPIFFAWAWDYLNKYPDQWYKEETILIYAFILPVLYLERTDNQIARAILGITCMSSLMLFLAAHNLKHQQPNPGDASHIYVIGWQLCAFYVALAAAYELYKLYGQDRPVR